MNTEFNCQKHLYFKLFKQLYITIQFSVSIVSMSKTVQFQTIQFSISSHFRCNYCLIVKKNFYFELFSFSKAVLIQLIQFSVSIISMSKTVQFQTIQFSISLQFRCNYCLIVKKKILFRAIQF